MKIIAWGNFSLNLCFANKCDDNPTQKVFNVCVQRGNKYVFAKLSLMEFFYQTKTTKYTRIPIFKDPH